MIKRANKNRGKLYLFSLTALAVVFIGLFFSKSSFLKDKQAEAAGGITIVGNAPPFQQGDVVGFAWGASTEAPTGGVGWINFNCKTSPVPNPCSGPAGNWGVKTDLTHSAAQGRLTGYAWSNNFGWLSFQPSDTRTCSSASGGGANQTATIEDLNNPTAPLKIVGWGKFISANTDPSGGWDGCVSFTHTPRLSFTPLYTTNVDFQTGDMSGFAWGSDVTGWISFDCDGCNTRVIMNPTEENLTFWADQYIVASPSDTRTLYWQASSGITACNSYSNTSGYAHWKRTLGAGSQPQNINNASGNLPSGSWVISGISQDTTYEITCSGPDGSIPTRYLTITTQSLVSACTDPTATNYTAPGPGIVSDNTLCNYGNNSPTLQLLVSQPTLIIGSGNYDEVLSWTSNVSTLHACVGSFFKATILGTTTHAVTGWTSPSTPSLVSPDVNNYVAVRDAGSGPNQFATLAGAVSNSSLNTHFIFGISCQDSANGNNPVTASATVNMIEPTVNTEPPLVQLWIQDPPTTGTPNNFQSSTEIPPWNTVTSSGGFNPVTLKWQELNVVPDSCVGDSDTYTGNNQTPIGHNSSWNGVALPDQGGGYGQMDLDITNQTDVHKTKFQIKCHPLNDPTNWVSAQVCMGISGEPFPQCSAGNSINRPPSYKEI